MPHPVRDFVVADSVSRQKRLAQSEKWVARWYLYRDEKRKTCPCFCRPRSASGSTIDSHMKRTAGAIDISRRHLSQITKPGYHWRRSHQSIDTEQVVHASRCGKLTMPHVPSIFSSPIPGGSSDRLSCCAPHSADPSTGARVHRHCRCLFLRPATGVAGHASLSSSSSDDDSRLPPI